MEVDKIQPITDQMWSTVNKFNRDMVEEFLQESVHLSPETLKQYKSNLRIYFWWIKENAQDKSLLEIKSRDFLKYQNWLVRRGLSSSTIRLKRASVSSLNEFILTYYEEDFETFKNYITKKIAAPPKAKVHEKIPLTQDEYQLLIRALEEREDWQKLAYVKFTYATGCRRSETIQLLKEVVDYEPVIKEVKTKDENGEEITVEAKYYLTNNIRCKGRGVEGKIRKLKFDEESMSAIKKWLEVRGEDDCPYVFVSKYGGEIQQLSTSSLNSWNSRIFSEIVGRRVHPHLFRSTRATDIVVLEGKNITAAQALLGHESSETTSIYVVRDTESDADEAFI